MTKYLIIYKDNRHRLNQQKTAYSFEEYEARLQEIADKDYQLLRVKTIEP